MMYPGIIICEDCGVAVIGDHECDPEKVVNLAAFKILPTFGVFEDAYTEWLNTNEGRFAQLMATRDRD